MANGQRKGADGRHHTLRWGEGSVEARTTARGEQRFVARWRDDNGRHAQTFGDEASAVRHLREVERRRELGTYIDRSRLTVRELVDWYLDSATRLTPVTVRTYRDRAANHIYPVLGERRAAPLSIVDVQRWLDGLVKGKIAPSTIQGAGAVLSGAYAEARRLGLLDANPVQGARFPGKRRSNTTYWTLAETQAVLAYLADDPFWYALYLLAITSGIRPGEARGLLWDDVRLDRQVITISRTMTRNERNEAMLGETTKTGRSRMIAIPAATVLALDALPRRSPFVFGAGRLRSDGPLPPANWQRKHRDICKATGVRAIRLHDLRHTSASLELLNHTHPKLVSERLGHHSISETLDRYTHVLDSMHIDAADRMSTLIHGIAGATTSRINEGGTE